MFKPLVSIIIRTKNESFWIGKCLHAIENQSYSNYEIIVVDNSSSDNTLGIIRRNFPKVKIIRYSSKKFYPGKAINLGIQKAKGKFIAMISGHCIPKDRFWIQNLLKNFTNKNIAGVYGKQEPLDTSDPNDVRDLIYLFGKDKKIQKKDPFFHNANSMIKKELWKKVKFNEETLHIEDRIWAQEQINKGNKLVYDPKPCVFHYHGISHRNNILRVRTISNILTQDSVNNKLRKLICMVPILDPIVKNNKFIVEEAIDKIVKIKEIEKVFVICDNKPLRKKLLNKKIIFLNRGDDLKKDFLGLEYVLKETYNKFIKKKYKPTHILVFEELYPHRPNNFFRKIIKNIDDNYDSLIPISKNKSHNLWKKNYKGDLEPIFKTTLPSSMADYDVFQELKGLGCVVKSSSFEVYGRESLNTKFFEVDSEYSFKIDNFTKKFI